MIKTRFDDENHKYDRALEFGNGHLPTT